MKKVVGLWIDHTKAVVFVLADEGTGITRITSKSNARVRSSGGVQKENVADDGDNRSQGRLNNYYDEVFSLIRDAESILIFGPGEAKREIQKRLESVELHGHIVGIETVETMTDNQIITKIRQRFLS
jgi:stalled ribosome rescue protein Dom34